MTVKSFLQTPWGSIQDLPKMSYSNVTRGKSKKRAEDNVVPYITESPKSATSSAK